MIGDFTKLSVMPKHHDKYRIHDDEDEEAEIERRRKRRRELYEKLGALSSITDVQNDGISGEFGFNLVLHSGFVGTLLITLNVDNLRMYFNSCLMDPCLLKAI